MRTFMVVLGFGALLLMTGCPPGGGRNPFIRPTSNPINRPDPTADTLIGEINQNAKLMQSVESRDLSIQASAGIQTIGLQGAISAQKPKNFRLQAKVIGKPAVDMGSNDSEFWYWITGQGESNPLVFCSYQDLANGKARMPFPFQPEWIIETLGMTERDPKATYQMVAQKNTFDLVEQTTSPQGQPVRKVTQFSRKPLADGRYQVTAHYLQDAKGETICSAHVVEQHFDKASGALVPRHVQLSWPAEKMQLDMVMDRRGVNSPMDANRAAALFTRPNMGGVRSVDLAKAISQPMGYVQQAGAYQPQPSSYPPRR